MREKALPPGRFRYEHGSYGGPGGYVPSILCYKETGPNSWAEHFCLVKPDAVFLEEGSACEVAGRHLAEAHAVMDAGGDIHDFALLLRHEGYKSVSDFRASDFRLATDSKDASNELRDDSVSLEQRDNTVAPSAEQIEQVARILAEWNPLGTSHVPDLNGYRTEAADILFGLSSLGSKPNVTQIVRQVLNEAFELSLSIDDCRAAAGRISAILETR